MLFLEPRKHIPLRLTIAMPIVSVAITLILGGVIFALLGYNPAHALYEFFIAPLSRPAQLGNLLVKACPLIIIGTGLIFCYRANVWNIGAEGQLILGAMGAAWVALSFPEADSRFLIFGMGAMAMLGGAAWAFIRQFSKCGFVPMRFWCH